jgi:hypothetical protein
MKERQIVPFIAGLILLSLGGILAIVTVTPAVAILGATRELSDDLMTFILFVWLIVLEYGCLATAPIALVTLPFTYFMLRRKTALTVRKLVFVGVVSAILEAILLMLGWLKSVERVDDISMLISVTILIIGLVVSFVFAHLTKLVRPADWGSQPAPIPSGA